ncbi:MAG: BatD family protein [Calditrichia bacterium]
MNLKRLHLLLLAIISILPLVGQSLIEVDAAVDRNRITIGDRIVYSLVIDRAENLDIRTPGDAANLGSFEIKDYSVAEPLVKDGRVREMFTYTISVFDTGTYVIPPFPIAFMSPDSQQQFITSEPLEIYVESILKEGDIELRDIKPPFNLPGDWLKWLLIVGGLLLIAGLAFGNWWYYRKQNGEGPVFRKEVIRPAHEIALEELDTLIQSDLLENMQHKSFFTMLSDILRRYVEGRYYIKAMEETTGELLNSMNDADLSADDIEYLQKSLTNCDLVKFAKFVPSEPQTQDTVKLVRAFIERTMLEFEAVERMEVVEDSEGEAEASSER